MSREEAIVIGKGHNEMSGIASEYDWIRKNRPGWTATTQALVVEGERAFDILTISKGGETQDIWFDITNFFGVL
jgi:hypothetical protein